MHPWSSAVKQCPYEHYNAWRAAAPIAWSEELSAWLIVGYEEASYVLEHDASFSSRNSIFTPDAENVDAFPSQINADNLRHAQLRALTEQAWVPRWGDQHSLSLVRSITKELLAAFAPGAFYVVRDLASPFSSRVMASLWGVDREDYDWFVSTSSAFVRGVGVPMHEESEAATNFFSAATQLRKYIGGQLELRRAEPRDDLLTRLAQAEADGRRLSDSEIHAFFMLNLIIGVETTTSLIANAVRALGEQPAMARRVRDDRTLVWNLIEETLRHDAPVQGLYRRARRDVEISGAQIRAGDALCVLYAAANRDPNYVECPASFNLDGARRDHLAFGRGVHECPAGGLARMVAEVAINAVLDQFETLTPIANDEPAPPASSARFFGAAAEQAFMYTLSEEERHRDFVSSYRFE